MEPQSEQFYGATERTTLCGHRVDNGATERTTT